MGLAGCHGECAVDEKVLAKCAVESGREGVALVPVVDGDVELTCGDESAQW